MMRVGSLCTGYGGLDAALALAGLDIEMAWVADNDPAASTVLAHHHPTVPNLGDITDVDWAEVEPVDILTAGFPCQDLSLAGRRAGITQGTRSGLWNDVAWAINNLRPRWALIENVRGILSGRAHSDVEPCPWCLGNRGGHGQEPALRALGAVLGDLSDLGYDARWVTVAAADVGAAHRRERVFILAHSADSTSVGHGNPWTSLLAGIPAAAVPGRPAADGVSLLPTPRTSDGNGSGAHGDGGPDLRTAVALLPTPAAARSGRQQSQSSGAAIRPSLDMITHLLPTPDATHGRKTSRTGPLLPGVVELLPTPRATDGTKGGPNQRGSSGDLMLPSAVQPGRWGVYAPAIQRWERVIGRPAPEPTESGKTGQRLSPLFVEWLMGLTHGWVTDLVGRTDALSLLGRGVVPQQGAYALRLLAEVA